MTENKELATEKAILIGVISQHQDEEKSQEYLDELEFLTFTAGGQAVKRFTQKLDVPNPKTFIGTGKLDEIKEYINAHDIKTAIFDDELNPAQLRNIEKTQLTLTCLMSESLFQLDTKEKKPLLIEKKVLE